MRDILLLNPHDTEQLGFTNPPLGLLYLAANLEKHGFSVRVVDACIEGKDAVKRALAAGRPDLVGITCLTPGRHQALELARMTKRFDPSIVVVLGGVHPTIMYRQILERYPFVDCIVRGEGDETLLELAQGRDWSTVKGIAFRKGHRVVKTPKRDLLESLDDIPFPAWHLIDLKKYPARGECVFRGIDLTREPRVSVIFSRGCSGHCDFCSTWWVWRGWRHRSPRNMVDELELLYSERGIRHFCFADDALTVDRQATIELCDEIVRRQLNIAFHATTRTDCVDEVVLQKLAAAGCYNIAFGVESAAQRILQGIGKDNSVDNARRAIALAKDAGIKVTALMIVGNVGETPASIRETVKFLQQTQPDVVGCAGSLWIFPGTKLYHDCKKKGFIDDSFWLGREPYKIYTMEWPREVLKEMEQAVVNYRAEALPADVDSGRERPFPAATLLDKWRRYVRVEKNEYSATTEWKDAQVQHLELMKNIPKGCKSVLDLGCGDGWSTFQLIQMGKEATGLTLNPAEADHARRRYGLNLVVRDMHDLPFADHRFDCVYCRESYEHSVAPYIALAEMNRVLRPGGYVLLNLPWEEWIREDSHYSVLNPSQMREMFYKCRFLIEQEGRSRSGHYWYLARKVAEMDQPHPEAPPLPGKAWIEGRVSEDSDNGRHLRPEPRIIAMMRIKNEARWLREVLDNVARLASGIVILDDGSTDATPQICRTHPAVVDYVWQNESELDEVRDKNRLLQMVLAQHPDWVLCMDGDELLEDSAPQRVLDAIQGKPKDVAVLDFHFLYMWNDLQHYRCDGIYRRIYHHRLFSLENQDAGSLAFFATCHGGNFHCESVPPNIKGKSMRIDVKIKHLGYMYAADRRRKFEWYRKNDPQHAAQGYYDHLLDQPHMEIAEWMERAYCPKGEADEIHKNESPQRVRKQELKPGYYYANARRDIADLVPSGAKKVLDVGCGEGFTGGLLRKERHIEVVGIEIQPEVAKIARSQLDRVIVGDIESCDLPFDDRYFDCIILADVLEHLINPWSALKKLSKYLTDAGTIIACIPNIRNLGVIRGLLDGSWSYQEQGILDRTHLRFFALRDMMALFEQAGFEARLVNIVIDPLFKPLQGSLPKQTADLTIGNLVLRGVDPDQVKELIAQQFILVARRSRCHDDALEDDLPRESRARFAMPMAVGDSIPPAIGSDVRSSGFIRASSQ